MADRLRKRSTRSKAGPATPGGGRAPDAPAVHSDGSSGPFGVAASAPAERSSARRTSDVDDALQSTLRRWARATPVEELSRRGVKTVRSVSMSKMAALLEKAVNRALIARTLGDDADDAGEVSAAARAEFVRLTRAELGAGGDGGSGGEFADEGLRRSARHSTLDRLKRDLAERERLEAGELVPKPPPTSAEREKREEIALESRLRDLAARVATGDAERELVESAIAISLEAVRDARRSAEDAADAEHARERSRLERRIAKLNHLLDDAEAKVRRARRGAPIDEGVASIYDEVQGLDGEDGDFEKKSSLMKSIFEANLALRP